MIRTFCKYLSGVTVILVLPGNCREVYDPPQGQATVNYLVVDGFLDINNPSIITLSRTRSLADSVPSIPELNAQVSVEGSNGIRYELNESGNGSYSIYSLPLDPNQRYRLDIATADGKLYQSDFVDVKLTPPIDSISFIKKNDGVHIYANTHDASGSSKYYQWEFQETWEYRSFFGSEYEYLDHQLLSRPPEHQVFRCWHYTSSNSIFVGSSANLSTDLIFENELVFIATAGEKLSVLYSIWVKQHVLTKEGYEFWQNLKKNTEELGSLFDAQPFQVTGNIHCVSNITEPVIGFVSAGSSDSSRIFIYEQQAEPWGYTIGLGCQEDISFPKDYERDFGDTLNFILTLPYLVQGLQVGVYGGGGELRGLPFARGGSHGLNRPIGPGNSNELYFMKITFLIGNYFSHLVWSTVTLGISSPASAQRGPCRKYRTSSRDYSRSALTEKVYVHTDKSFFIWLVK